MIEVNVEKSLIELLLNEELDLEAFRAHSFVQSLRKALVVGKMSDRELFERLKHDIFYWMLVSRWARLELLDVQKVGVQDPALENASNTAIGKVLESEIKLVGPDNPSRIFLPLGIGIRDTFEDSQSAQRAIRRIEKTKGGNPKAPSRSSTKGRKAGRKCCDAA
ncbi:MAG: hypothetical protein HYY99_00440 [Candidatus Colwellbacteria bacterium]|nr:hypothetical protein [Candidatus Colwellbacteria bacterium]